MPIRVLEFDGALLAGLNAQKPVTSAHRPTLDDARRVSRELSGVVRPLGVLVFGSIARGEAEKASDIDLLCLVKRQSTDLVHGILNHVSDLGHRVTIQLVDLQTLFGCLLARDPFLLGSLASAIILADPSGILSALREAARRTEVVPSTSTGSFLRARAERRMHIAKSLERDAMEHLIASATDLGFGFAHILGRAPRTVPEMVKLLNESNETRPLGQAISEVWDMRQEPMDLEFHEVERRVNLIKAISRPCWEKLLHNKR